MSANYENIIATQRHRLEEVIPLDTPYSICIDPSNLCNFKCNFCAVQKSNEKVRFKKELMPMELFQKIIDDSKHFNNKIKVLRINGQGEPLLNPRFVDMITYAKRSGVADYIETITNGSRFEPELNQKIADSGINRIRISIEAVNEEGYLNTSNVKLDFEQFINNIKDLYERTRGKCELYVKTVDAALDSDEKKDLFFQLFGDICDRIFVDKVIPLWSDYSEIEDYYEISKCEGVHGQQVKQVQICPYPFYSCIINPDGEVTVCCADWKRHLVVGNAGKDSIVHIWHSELLRKFWVDLASKRKNDYEMCKKCLLPTYDCNDDIDDFGDIIVKKLLAKGV